MDIKQKGPLLFAAPFFGIFMAKGMCAFLRGRKGTGFTTEGALDSVPYLISPPSFPLIPTNFLLGLFLRLLQNEMAPIPQSEQREGAFAL